MDWLVGILGLAIGLAIGWPRFAYQTGRNKTPYGPIWFFLGMVFVSAVAVVVLTLFDK